MSAEWSDSFSLMCLPLIQVWEMSHTFDPLYVRYILPLNLFCNVLVPGWSWYNLVGW